MEGCELFLQHNRNNMRRKIIYSILMNDKNSIYRDTVLKFCGLIKISYVQECFWMGAWAAK